jgi:hypothetical protein
VGDERRGSLTLRAALVLDAADPLWGGWSGAALDGDRLWAVSDVGGWMELALVHDAAGRLTGVTPQARGILHDEHGDPLSGKQHGDAEGLARDEVGWVVSFERDHRLLRYRGTPGEGSAERLALPEPFRAPPNGGIEALGRTGDRWVLMVEGHDGEAGPHGVWLGGPAKWQQASLVRTGTFLPVELAALPDGDLLLVERSYTKADGVAIRVSRLPAASLVAGAMIVGSELAVLTPPLPLDNFEAAGTDGRWLYLLSDDNLSADQRTLLLQLELDR